MAAQTTGLSTHIWNNNLRSGILLAVYPILLAGIAWLAAMLFSLTFATKKDPLTFGSDANFAFANDIAIKSLPFVGGATLLWFAISWFGHTRMIRKMSHSHPVTRKQEPELYNLLENLSISAGIPMPRLEIIETHARNAFASGIDTKSYTVTVTRGLLQSLEKDEVEAVLAHELTHIRNSDVRLLIISVIFTGLIGFTAQMVSRSMRWRVRPRGRGRDGGRLILFMLALSAILWLGYLCTSLTRLALSRRREYMADGGAIQLTKNPDAMMRALMRISGMEQMKHLSNDVAQMCISNTQPFLGLFSTHPPIKQRIATISEMTGTPIPDTPKSIRTEDETRFSNPNKKHEPWIIRQRHNNFDNNPWD